MFELEFAQILLRSCTEGSYGSSIFNFLRHLHAILHSGCINLHFYQQCWNAPLQPETFLDRRLKCPCLVLQQRTSCGWYLITLMSNRGLRILLIGSLSCLLPTGKVTRPDPKTFHLLLLVYHFSNCSACPSIYLTQKSLECYSPLSQKYSPSSGLYLCLLNVFCFTFFQSVLHSADKMMFLNYRKNIISCFA